jgi:hypothetical protein
MKRLTFICCLFAGVITSAQAAPSSPTTNTESVKQIEEVVRVFQTYLIKKDGSVALTNVNQTYYWDLIRSQTERICPAKV